MTALLVRKFTRWQADRSDGPDPQDDALHRLAVGVVRGAAADLRHDPGMRDWLAGELGEPWLVAAMGEAAAQRIRGRLEDPGGLEAIVERMRGTRLD